MDFINIDTKQGTVKIKLEELREGRRSAVLDLLSSMGVKELTDAHELQLIGNLLEEHVGIAEASRILDTIGKYVKQKIFFR
ncbi:hypothetical protein DID75_04370 [Candidatus Marinamargulisbacteria bacterium SCGC AG-410-N11]|nr:hypothetical protein DID75_04370 [Candidatus Marinamargulisbacteria bacterium SCGC AG-410-N11]